MNTRRLVITLIFLLLATPIWAQSSWGQQVVESTMERNTPSELGAWTYQRGFYLFGQYRIWQLTGDDRYFEYIQDWLDLHVDSEGNINQTINSLDNSEPALIDLLMYGETGQEQYRLAADSVRDVYRTYPTTSDGGFWHGMSLNGQLWLDGVYMCTPFLANYAQTFDDEDLFDVVANQIIVYAGHLQDPNGLMYHAYDEDGSSSWADDETLHSPHFWGRSMGWFGMAIIEILEVLPEDHVQRDTLLEILTHLIEGLSQVQDEETGLWYQVPNRGEDPNNWLESSCSSMFSFCTARAVQKGYVDPNYLVMAEQAYRGVIDNKISFTEDDLINLNDICQGTGVSNDVNYYFQRERNTNDLHGLGAFLMMCWQMDQMDAWREDANEPPFVQILAPSDATTLWPGSDLDVNVLPLAPDGQVQQVDLYANDQCIATLTEAPWITTWSSADVGTYELIAVATDDQGYQSTSHAVTVTVSYDSMIVEAETGSISSGSVDTDHAGYSGDGFVNLDNQANTYLTLPIQIPAEGRWDVSICYANGTTDNRPCLIAWGNQVVQESYDFPSTETWINWSLSESFEMDVTAGDHVMLIVGLESTSAPNLDYVQWTYLEDSNEITDSEALDWAERMAASVVSRHPTVYKDWDYVTGTVLRSFEELWRVTGDETYFDYIEQTISPLIASDGTISGYSESSYNIDEIKTGIMLLLLYEETDEQRYLLAADNLRGQLERHPRTSEGGFWHKQRYPWQMWLDGLYMGTPFYAYYGKVTDESAAFDDVVNQFVLMETHARDDETGLLYHGWDESKEQDWADPVTGCSPSFWGRAIGWYAMALVDVLDFLPENHEGHDTLIGILQRLATAMLAQQDEESGVWWQVVDQGNREGNYLESSVSCMMVYALAKGIRMGYLDEALYPAVSQAYQGVLDNFITENTDGTLNVIQICKTAGLGYGRDGSYDYYVYQESKSVNDGKGVGPFITASVEMARLSQ